MDGQRFDDLTKAMAGGATRRGALRLLAGGALAGALARLDLGSTAAQDVGAAHCVPNGTICTGRRRLGTRHRHSCRDCCSGFSTRRPGGARRCSCRPDGASCGGSAAKCCSGVCGADGTCGGTQEPEPTGAITGAVVFSELRPYNRRYVGVTGTGFLPGARIAFTVTFAHEDGNTYSGLNGHPGVFADAGGTFDSGTSPSTTTTYIVLSCAANTVGIEATDGTNTASREFTFPAC